MALMSAPEASAFESDLRTIQASIRAGVTHAYARRKDSHWELWHEFCLSQHIDPFLSGTKDPVPLLQVFAAR